MRLDRDNTYVFDPFNKYQIIKRPASEMFIYDFTLAVTVEPDYESIEKELKAELAESSDTAFINGCITGANGMHQGIFLSSFFEDGELKHVLKYDWWEEEGDEKIAKHIGLLINPDDSNKLDIVVVRKENDLTLTVNGETVRGEIGTLIDYSYSWRWVGAGNKLNVGKEDYDEKFASIFQGEIFKYHYQFGQLWQEDIDSIFNDYEQFKESYLYGDDAEFIFISTDFKESTPYKIKDYSTNNNHLLKLDTRWFD